MERYPFCIVPVGLIVLGAFMVVWPAAIVAHNRDAADDASSPTPGQLWRTRVLGAVLVAAGAYGLCALLANLPGAEFSPA